MRLPWHQSGAAGWTLLALVVIGWDVAAPETMSDAFGRAAATPAGKAALVLGWGLLTAHLFAVLPDDRDPLRVVIAEAQKLRGVACRGSLLQQVR